MLYYKYFESHIAYHRIILSCFHNNDTSLTKKPLNADSQLANALSSTFAETLYFNLKYSYSPDWEKGKKISPKDPRS